MSQIAKPQSGATIVIPWTLEGNRVTTWEELEKTLMGLHEKAPMPNSIVNLVSPGGDTLSMGIAGPMDEDNPTLSEQLACLNFMPASSNPPYLTVVGDSSLSYEHGGVVVFRFDGDWTEILRRNCVLVHEMLQVVKHFFLTGSLPMWIPWEEV